jgi:hypothetical protein
MQRFMGKHVAMHFSKVRGMKRVSVQGIILAVCCFAAAPCAAQQAQNAPTTVAAKPVAPPPLTQAERRLAKAKLLADLMSPEDVTLDMFQANIISGFRIGFAASPENRALAVQYPGLENAIALAMQPRARKLVEIDREPIQAATASYLADQFTIAELDQGIRLYRHPIMIKLIRNSFAGARAEATARDLKAQLAQGNTDLKISSAAVTRDGTQSARRAFAKLTAAEVRVLVPLMQTEFTEKMNRIRPVIDQQMITILQESSQRVSSDEEMRTLAVAAMAEFIAKADAAKPAVSAAIPTPIK